MKFTQNTGNDITYMSSPNISAVHAFGTRSGSVRAALGIAQDDIICLKQVHSASIISATQEHRGKLLHPSPEGDGLITNEPNVALTVFTADCVPILLYDPVKNAIGAVHAGWRGTALDIVGEAVRKMENLYNCRLSDIKAAIGPCISKCCFVTDLDVADAIRVAVEKSGTSETANVIAAGADNPNKYLVDLKKANRLLLESAGVCDIAVSDECTSCSSDKYWSHRKTKGKRGTQAAVIVLN